LQGFRPVFSINGRCVTGCPESVVDIHNGKARSAAVKHPEKSSNSTKTGSITYGCWYSHHRAAAYSTHHTGEVIRIRFPFGK